LAVLGWREGTKKEEETLEESCLLDSRREEEKLEVQGGGKRMDNKRKGDVKLTLTHGERSLGGEGARSPRKGKRGGNIQEE